MRKKEAEVGRFNLTRTPSAHAINNGCYWSGLPVDGNVVFLDLDAQLDLDHPIGHLYAAEPVVAEWARLIGYLSPVEFNKLEAELAAAEVELAQLRAYKKNTESVLEGLSRLGVAVEAAPKRVKADV